MTSHICVWFRVVHDSNVIRDITGLIYYFRVSANGLPPVLDKCVCKPVTCIWEIMVNHLCEEYLYISLAIHGIRLMVDISVVWG